MHFTVSKGYIFSLSVCKMGEGIKKCILLYEGEILGVGGFRKRGSGGVMGVASLMGCETEHIP